MWKIPLIITLTAVILSGCSSQQNAARPAAHVSTATEEPKYTTAFPDRDVSEHLKKAQKSILRIVSTGSYETFIFEPDQITLPDIKTNKPADIARQYYSADESAAGTAILLEHGPEQSLLITCEHVVAFPDTVISYYEGDDIPDNKFIESISIKRRQSNLIYTPFQFQKFDVIATNPAHDLALLSASLPEEIRTIQQPLELLPGQTKYLQFGSFLYVLGFPKGYPMVTRGLASTPGEWSSRFIITDALFNPGISGGLIMASNDDFDSFQWIGMASSATATRESMLVPRPGESYNRGIRPYQDSLFVEQKSRLSYGITQAIPMNHIKKFLDDNRDILNRYGFSYRPR